MKKEGSYAATPFSAVTYSDFEDLAKNASLSKYEKIGFPDHLRKGYENFILEDIIAKCENLTKHCGVVVDIGAGCSDLPIMLAKECEKNKGEIYLVDSAEMLQHLPDGDHIQKVEAFFPDCLEFIENLKGRVDVIICYSVLQYVVVDTSLLKFIDACLTMLAPGGQFLIGDIPNISKKKRFLSSQAGAEFHKRYMSTEKPPEINYNEICFQEIDDSVIAGVLLRARAAGFDAYVVPQRPSLPMSNRREDILIIRP